MSRAERPRWRNVATGFACGQREKAVCPEIMFKPKQRPDDDLTKVISL